MSAARKSVAAATDIGHEISRPREFTSWRGVTGWAMPRESWFAHCWRHGRTLCGAYTARTQGETMRLHRSPESVTCRGTCKRCLARSQARRRRFTRESS